MTEQWSEPGPVFYKSPIVAVRRRGPSMLGSGEVALPSDQSRRLVPVTTISASRLPRAEQTSRCCHSGTGVPAPYLCACSAGSGSTRCPQSRHQTINRTPAAAAPPSVMGRPGGVFFRRSALGALSLLGWRLRWSIFAPAAGSPHYSGPEPTSPLSIATA
jgi:hypothetical protein